MAFVYAAAVILVPAAVALKIWTSSNIKEIEGDMDVYNGKASFKVTYNKLTLLATGIADATVISSIRLKDADVASALEKALNDVIKEQDLHATAKVNVSSVKLIRLPAHGNGHHKNLVGDVKDDQGTTYTVKITSGSPVAMFPVLYCPGVKVNVAQPLLNTWLVSDQQVSKDDGQDHEISWVVQYSIIMSEVQVKSGGTFKSTITCPIQLGWGVQFYFDDQGTMIHDPTYPLDKSHSNTIQVSIPAGASYDKWGIGFGIGDPTAQATTCVMAVKAAAGVTYTFTPTPSYIIALQSQDDTNKLVKESQITNQGPFTFDGTSTTMYANFSDEGRWTCTTVKPTAVIPYNGMNKLPVPFTCRLIKKTITNTTTTIEEYA